MANIRSKRRSSGSTVHALSTLPRVLVCLGQVISKSDAPTFRQRLTLPLRDRPGKCRDLIAIEDFWKWNAAMRECKGKTFTEWHSTSYSIQWIIRYILEKREGFTLFIRSTGSGGSSSFIHLFTHSIYCMQMDGSQTTNVMINYLTTIGISEDQWWEWSVTGGFDHPKAFRKTSLGMRNLNWH